MHNLSDKPHFHHARMSDDGGPEPEGHAEIYKDEMDRVFGATEPPPKPYHGLAMPPNMVVLPKHYSRFQMEPVHFTVTNKLDLLESNVIKYTMRAPYKHGDKGQQDYRKAIRCLVMKAKQMMGDPEWWRPYKTGLEAMLDEELSYDGT